MITSKMCSKNISKKLRNISIYPKQMNRMKKKKLIKSRTKKKMVIKKKNGADLKEKRWDGFEWQTWKLELNVLIWSKHGT